MHPILIEELAKARVAQLRKEAEQARRVRTVERSYRPRPARGVSRMGLLGVLALGLAAVGLVAFANGLAALGIAAAALVGLGLAGARWGVDSREAREWTPAGFGS
jgi:hypothetical protein